MSSNQDLTEFRASLNKKHVIVVYFSTIQCTVCKVLRPKVEDLVSQFKEIDFIYVNTEEKPLIAGQYTVFSVPTIIIFSEGREYKRFSRSFSINEIQNYLQRLLHLLS